MFCLFSIFSTVISHSTLARESEHGVVGKTMLHILLYGKNAVNRAWMLVDSQLVKIHTFGHRTFTKWLGS